MHADNDTEGTGFGLPSSLAILDRLHGTLELTSTVGDGTKAAIMLPLVASEDPVGLNEFGGMAKRAGFLLIDADGDQTPDADGLQLAPGDHPPVLHATFDPSSGKRAELAQKARIALLKPLSPEMLEHPAVLQLHAANAPRRAV